MKIKHYQIPKETLEKLGLEKGTDIIRISMASTELSFLLKTLLAFIHPLEQIQEGKERTEKKEIIKANLTVVMMIIFFIIGKSKEVWEMFKNERFQNDYFKRLDDDDQRLYKVLKKYFNDNMKWMKRIRDENAFHYSEKFKSHFYAEGKGCEFPELNLWSNLHVSGGSGATIFSDLIVIMSLGESKREEEEPWVGLFEKIKEYLPQLIFLLDQLVLYIVDSERMTMESIEIPDLKAGDNMLTNYFWEPSLPNTRPEEK